MRGYDYSQPGSYFVTVCTKGRESLFGNVIDEEVALNFAGRVVQEEWSYTEIIRPEVQVDEFVIMPNHIHGIITIREPEGLVGAHGRAALPCGNSMFRRPPRSLGSLLSGFKSAETKRINQSRHTPVCPYGNGITTNTVGAHGRAPLPAGRRLSNHDFSPLPGRREIGRPSLFERLQAFFDVVAEESQHLQR